MAGRAGNLGLSFFLSVTAELETHGGQYFCGKVELTARRETLVERFAQDGSGCAGFDGGDDGPAPLAGVRDAAGETLEGWLLEQGDGGEIEEPGGDDAAAAPDFGDVGQIEIVLVVLGVAQG